MDNNTSDLIASMVYNAETFASNAKAAIEALKNSATKDMNEEEKKIFEQQLQKAGVDDKLKQMADGLNELKSTLTNG